MAAQIQLAHKAEYRMSPSSERTKQDLEVSADLIVDLIRHTLRLAQVRHVAGFRYLEDVRVDGDGNAVIQRHQTDAIRHLIFKRTMNDDY